MISLLIPNGIPSGLYSNARRPLAMLVVTDMARS